ncbi:MAG: hypothetical protein ACFHVJ_10550 [Aestuariibacter sp.]
MKSEKAFVYDTAAQIYAAMFANPEVKEDMRYAIDRAVELWDELNKVNFNPDSDVPE